VPTAFQPKFSDRPVVPTISPVINAPTRPIFTNFAHYRRTQTTANTCNFSKESATTQNLILKLFEEKIAGKRDEYRAAVYKNDFDSGE
jgi:hypothetical protein